MREIEKSIETAENERREFTPSIEKPAGVPVLFSDYLQLMFDLQIAAMQADLTRVVTFMFGREGSLRTYAEIGVPESHHPLTHHMNKPDLMEKVSQINVYHVKQLAGWVEKLKSIKEGDGSLLDNCMIVYGAGLTDGNKHNHEDLPTIMLGRGGGAIRPGYRRVYRRETPMSNLFLTMMDNMGVKAEHFGDSTGRINGLDLA